jgi:GAF domain-containing protein
MVLEAQQIERVESENQAGQVEARERMAVQRDELIDRLREALGATAFSNRFLLSPRRLPQIAKAEADAFLDFLKTGDADRIRKQGVKRAEEGLGERSTLRLGTALGQFCRDKLADKALRAADVYTNALLEGFMEGREAIVLREQEQIQRALQKVASKRALQLATAAEVSRAASSILDTDELLAEIVYLICDRFDLYYVGIFLVDETSEYVILRAGTGTAGLQMLKAGHKFKIGDTSMVGWCAANAQARIALDVGREAVRFDNPLLPETRSEMALPLISRGWVIGVMTIQSIKPDAFSEEDIAVLQTMADQLANAIHNARLYEAEQKQVVQLAVVNQVARRAASILDIDQLSQQVVTAIQQSFKYHNVALALLDETVGELEVRAIAGDFADMVPPGYRQAVDTGITGWVAKTGQSLLSNDVSQEPRYVPGFLEEPLTKSELCVPLKLAGQVIGVLDAQDIRLNAFDETNLMAMETLADQIAVAIENARLFQETQAGLAEVAALYQASQRITAAEATEDILQAVLDYIVQPPLDRVLIALFDPDAPPEEPVAVVSTIWDRDPALMEALCGQRFTASELPMIATLDPNTTIVVNNVDIDEQLDEATRFYFQNFSVKSAVAMPIIAAGDHLGWMVIGITQDYHTFTEEEFRPYQSIIGQAAVAIANARAYEREQRRADQLRVVNEVGRTLTSILDVDTLIGQVVRLIRDAFDYYQVNLALIEGNALVPKAWAGDLSTFPVESARIELDAESIVTQAVASRTPLLVSDTRREPLYVPLPGLEEIRSELAVPLKSKGRVIGVLDVESDRPAAFDRMDLTVMEALAGQITVAIENARLFQETQIHAKELAVLNEMGRALTTMLDADTVIESLYQHAHRLIDTTNFYVALYHPEQDEVSFPLYAEGDQRRRLERRRGGKGLTEHVIQTREPLLIEENAIKRLEELGIEMMGQEAQSWLGVPMISGEQVIGVIAVQSYTTPRLYNEHHRDLLSAIANQAAIAIENARLFERAQARARREQILREITARVRGSTDPDTILRTAVRDLGTALGRPTFVRLGSAEQLPPIPVAQTDGGEGQGTAQKGQHPERVEGGE